MATGPDSTESEASWQHVDDAAGSEASWAMPEPHERSCLESDAASQASWTMPDFVQHDGNESEASWAQDSELASDSESRLLHSVTSGKKTAGKRTSTSTLGIAMVAVPEAPTTHPHCSAKVAVIMC